MDCREELEELKKITTGLGAVAAEIRAKDVVIAEWVRFRCRYGCKGYAKHLSCPPYAPDPGETQRMVDGYSVGLLLRFDGVPGHPVIRPDDIPDDFHQFYADLIRWVNTTIWTIEKTAYYDGFYKAFGFGAYPCSYCKTCVAEEQTGPVDESLRRSCRHMDQVRPSMEAAGMDVFATAAAVGWHLHTIPSRDLEYGKILHGNLQSVGLVLIE